MNTSSPTPGPARVVLRVLAVAILWGASAAHAKAIDDLHAFVTQFQTAQGEFTQRVESTTKHVSQSSGTFVFARPGRFRWIYTKPYEQALFADGQTLTIYDKDLAQATTRKLTDALGSTPAALLFGENTLEKSFDLSDDGSADGIDWLIAIPKTKDTSFTRIRIGFRSGALAAMALDDALGQKTLLTFSGVQRNVAVAPNTFHFVAPKGVDILSQ
jgi:outer membrane lipoprotein carrier protein